MTLGVFQCGAVHLLADCSHGAAVAARLRSASRGSAAFGAEVGRMAENSGDGHYTAGFPLTMSLNKHRDIAFSHLSP